MISRQLLRGMRAQTRSQYSLCAIGRTRFVSTTPNAASTESQSPEAASTSTDPKPFVAPPTWQTRTPEWLLKSPTFVNLVQGTARLLGHNSKTTTAIRESRELYRQCAEREVKETGFIYVECRLAPTFQTWFAFTNVHVWLLTTRLRALPPPFGRMYVQETINHFFLDAEYRLRAVYGPKCPERIIKRQMVDLRDQWNGSNAAYDLAVMTGDTELAAAIWRNVFAARGEKAYKEANLPVEERDALIEKRRKANDPEADGAPLEDIPNLVFQFVAHIRREMQRLEGVPDGEVIAGRVGKIGRIGTLGHPDVEMLDSLSL